MGNVRFIRVNGRVVPLREKTLNSKKTVSRGAGERALSGAKSGAKLGAVVGAAGGILAGQGIKGAVKFAAHGAVNWGILGAGVGAIFGRRKGQITVKKKVYTSR